jgi:hypothetical protein
MSLTWWNIRMWMFSFPSCCFRLQSYNIIELLAFAFCLIGILSSIIEYFCRNMFMIFWNSISVIDGLCKIIQLRLLILTPCGCVFLLYILYFSAMRLCSEIDLFIIHLLALDKWDISMVGFLLRTRTEWMMNLPIRCDIIDSWG